MLNYSTHQIFLFLVLLIIGKSSSNDNGMTYFEKPGKCISKKDFKVFQVIGEGYALAEERLEFSSGITLPGNLLVLVTNDNGELYYDDQIIEVPKGKCMRQIGVYEYQTKSENWKTVPIVQLMNE